jgi:WD40 repeat protein/serine/threonine protein kinase
MAEHDDYTLTGGGEQFRKDEEQTLTGGGPSQTSSPRTPTASTPFPHDTADRTLTHTEGKTTHTLIDKVNWEIGDIIDGRYEVVSVIGRGGKGIVYKVNHLEWKLELAVKMPLAHLVADDVSKARFIREAQTWVDLGLHPNIVQCWYVRELGGMPRLFMDYIGGGSLKDWIRDGKIIAEDWERIIDLIIQACDGLSYAHEQGMEVHRDIKPGNMLMSERGDLLVTDFGIAKREGSEIEGHSAEEIVVETGDQSTITVTGSELGTPEYGAPEQWGKARHADTRADIYALGIVLFELCCGRRPFDDGIHREPPHVLIGRHLSVPAPDPRSFNSAIPTMLAELITQCLAKSPDDRPASMTELRERLAEVHVKVLGKPSRRVKPQTVELRSDALNNRAASMLDLGERAAAFEAWQEALKLDPYHPESLYNQTLLQWRAAEITDDDAARKLAEAAHTDRRSDLYMGYLQLERAAADLAESALLRAVRDQQLATNGAIWRTIGDTQMAQEKYAEAEQAYQKALDLIPGDFGSLERQTMAQVGTRFRGHPQVFPWRHCHYALENGHYRRVTAVAALPNSRFMVSASQDMTLRLWDLVTRACIWTTRGHEDMILALAVSSDGRMIVSGSQDMTIRIWESATGKSRWIGRGHSDRVSAVAITPNGRFIVSGSRDKTLRLWSVSSGKTIWVSEKHAAAVTALAITPDGKFVLSGHDEENLYLWDIATGKRIERKYYGAALENLGFVTAATTSLVITPDGQFAVSGSRDTSVRLWNVQSGEIIRVYTGHEKTVTSVAVSRNGKWIISGSTDGTVRHWETDTGNCTWASRVHEAEVTGVAITPAGQWVVSGSQDKTLRQIDVNTGKSPWTFGGQNAHQDEISGLTMVPQGRFVASSSYDMTLRLWDLKNVRCARVFEGPMRGLTSVAITPDRKYVLAACRDTTIWMWELLSTQKVRLFEGHTAEVRSVTVSPDGRHVISGSDDQTLRVWDLETGKCLRVLEGHLVGVTFVTVSENGQWIASGGKDATMRLWELESGKSLGVYEGHRDTVTSVAISAKGRSLISSSLDRTIVLWEQQTGECVQVYTGHKDGVRTAIFSHDERCIVSGGADGTVRLWDVDTTRCLRTFTGHTKAVTALIMTPEGQALSGSQDASLRLWELELDAQAYEATVQVCRQQSHGELQSSTQRFRQQITWAKTALKSGKPIVAYKYITHARSVPGYERAPELLEFNAALGNLLPRKGLRGRWLLRTFKGHEEGITTVFLTPDGRFAVSGSKDGTLRKWDLLTAQCTLIFKGHTKSIAGGIITPDGRFVVSSSQDMTLRLWDLATAKCLRVYKGHKQPVTAVTIAQYGRFIVSGSEDMTLKVWNPATAECLRTLKGHRKSVTSVMVTPDKRFILSGSEDKTLRLWNHVTGECVQTMRGHRHPISAVAVASDGSFFLSGGEDKTIRIWDTITGKSRRILRGHDDAVTSVVLTPDARFIISGSRDRTLRLWEVHTGECLGIFEQHRQAIRTVALTPDARFVMSGSEERVLYQWELDWELESTESSASSEQSDAQNATLVNRIVSLFNKYEKR